jgi:hypothetical protein
MQPELGCASEVYVIQTCYVGFIFLAYTHTTEVQKRWGPGQYISAEKHAV